MFIIFSVRFQRKKVFIIVFVRFFGRFGLPFWTVSGPFLERFRPENGQKGPFFSARFARQILRNKKVFIILSVRFWDFKRVSSGEGGLLILIAWYLLMLWHLLLTGFQNSRFWNLEFQILENQLFSAMERLLRFLEAAPTQQSIPLYQLQLTDCYDNFITKILDFQISVPEFQISGKCLSGQSKLFPNMIVTGCKNMCLWIYSLRRDLPDRLFLFVLTV